MFKNFALTFSPECSEFIENSYAKADSILEYGSGGSTILAAKMQKLVVTTESSIEWLMELVAAGQEKQLPGKIVPIWVDIGQTKEWGYPVDDSHWRNWPNYSLKPWLYCREHNIKPELILIDGRFRVSCFVASCLNVNSPTTIVFDDYQNRPEYHIVENFIKPIKIIDNSMAIFEVDKNTISKYQLTDFIQYFTDPR
jgi:hypothetical protein